MAADDFEDAVVELDQAVDSARSESVVTTPQPTKVSLLPST